MYERRVLLKFFYPESTQAPGSGGSVPGEKIPTRAEKSFLDTDADFRATIGTYMLSPLLGSSSSRDSTTSFFLLIDPEWEKDSDGSAAVVVLVTPDGEIYVV